jgi:hypothetical protein
MRIIYMKSYCLFFLSIMFLHLAIPQASTAGEVVDGVYYSDEALEKRQLLLDLREAINNPPQDIPEPESFTGYGRVIDQHGNPVVNARVEAQWDRFEIVSGFGLKRLVDDELFNTDPNGYFAVTTPNGAIPILFGVEAKGYEEQMWLSPYADKHGKERDDMMKNSANDPIILHMRKLNPTTFLLKSGVSHYFKEPNTTLRYTMIPGLLRPIDPDLSKLKKPEQNDLIFTVNKNGDGSYTMHIQPVPEIGGSMQILDDYLYAAPTGGYSQEISLTIRPEDGKVTKYLYFTSRKSSVYSRMEMELRVRDEGDLQFHSSTWSNPYGKRNLEWEPELPNKLRHKLRNEAEEALINGKLVEEPTDLQALIDQYLAVETN